MAAMVENEPVESGHREAGILRSKCLKSLKRGDLVVEARDCFTSFAMTLNMGYS
jgi:hypothetical protein